MSQTYFQDGCTLSLTAPSGGVDSGDQLFIGSQFVVAEVTAAEGETFAARTDGVHYLTKVGSQAWTEGLKIYANSSTFVLSSDSTVGPLVGVATAAVGSGAGETKGYVKLLGNASSTAEGAQANIAALTFGTNITAATANGSLTDSSATNPTDAQFNELAKELGTKVNAIISALVAAGIIAAP